MFKVTLREKPKAAPAETVSTLPTGLKKQAELRSGLSLEAVRIHYSSEKPARAGAFAYAQGDSVYLGPGQERLLPHELAHVVQQKQGRVPVTGAAGGLPINGDGALEREADSFAIQRVQPPLPAPAPVAQRKLIVKTNPRNPSQKVTIQCVRDLYSLFDAGQYIHDSVAAAAAGIVPNDDPRALRVVLDMLNSAFSEPTTEELTPDVLPTRLDALLHEHLDAVRANLERIAAEQIEEPIAGDIMGCPSIPIGLKPGSSSLPEPLGYIYRSLLQNGIIPTGFPSVPLGHEDGHEMKVFAFQCGGHYYKFAEGRHVNAKATKTTKFTIYEIIMVFGFLDEIVKPGQFIKLDNGRMYVGSLTDLKRRGGGLLL